MSYVKQVAQRAMIAHLSPMCQGQISFQKTYKWAMETRGPKSNLSELLCLSWLPATLMMICSKMKELAWRHHFPIISLWEIFKISRQLTPKSAVRYGQNSNSSEILCMSALPAIIKRIGSKTTEKSWRHHFPHYKSVEAFCCHGNQSFDPIFTKTLCSLSPTPMMLHINIQVQSAKFSSLKGKLLQIEWSDLAPNRT